jgi:Zn-dependent protease
LRNVVDAIDSAAKAAGYPAKIVSNKFQHAAIFWPVRGISCPLLADH